MYMSKGTQFKLYLRSSRFVKSKLFEQFQRPICFPSSPPNFAASEEMLLSINSLIAINSPFRCQLFCHPSAVHSPHLQMMSRKEYILESSVLHHPHILVCICISFIQQYISICVQYSQAKWINYNMVWFIPEVASVCCQLFKISKHNTQLAQVTSHWGWGSSFQ